MDLAPEAAARYARQILVDEIGPDGQARIGARIAEVAGEDPAHAWAARYAERAGFAGLAPGAIDVEALAPPALIGDPTARALLAGCRAALAALRRAAGIEA